MKRLLFSCYAMAFLLASFGNAVARTPVSGNDFLTGSVTVDVINYLDSLNVQDAKNFYFGLDAKWTPAELQVRSVDINGMPLLGQSSSGLIEGSLMKYRVGLVIPFDGIRGIFLMDYFVASHIDNFFTLLSPMEVFATFHGGKLSGFGAIAGQMTLGADISILPNITAGVFGVVKFRDAIDSNGMFLSTYRDGTVILQYDGDYMDSALIPKGTGGFSQFEPYFYLSVFGIKINSAFNFDLGLVFASLAKQFGPELLKEIPLMGWLSKFYGAFEYVNKAYNFFQIDNSFKSVLNFSYQLPFAMTLNYLDVSLFPFRFNEARLELAFGDPSANFFIGASALNQKDSAILLYGGKTGFSFGKVLDFTVSYNYGEQMLAGLSVRDELSFAFKIIVNFDTSTIN